MADLGAPLEIREADPVTLPYPSLVPGPSPFPPSTSPLSPTPQEAPSLVPV